MSPAQPRRGQLWWVAFDALVGSETRKTRAAAVVSTDAANRALDRVQVLPITSKVAKVYPAQVLVTREKTSAQGYGRITSRRSPSFVCAGAWAASIR
jgi:mRNA-degrading endonuclease toxin of MazEF toxin-antitoxin module